MNKERKTIRFSFTDLMRPGERVAALCYLFIHVFALPLTLPYLPLLIPGLSGVDVNLIYYALGLAFVFIFCMRFLRAGFDAALDFPANFLLCVSMAFVIELGLSMVINSLMELAVPGLGSAPNNETLLSMAPQGLGKLRAMTIFMAPIVEEVLFRGLVFGALRTKSRAAAWIVSLLAFSLYHVWQYIPSGGLSQLIYCAAYIPGAAALNSSYERSGSIWAPIAYHMLINAVTLGALL